jgi:hypothetical protein
MLGATDLAHNLIVKRGFQTLPKTSMWIALAVALVRMIVVFFRLYAIMLSVLPKGPNLCGSCSELIRYNTAL